VFGAKASYKTSGWLRGSVQFVQLRASCVKFYLSCSGILQCC